MQCYVLYCNYQTKERKISMKKLLTNFIILALTASMLVSLTACENSTENELLKKENEELKQQLETTPTPTPTIIPTLAPTPIPTSPPQPAKKEFVRENYGYVDYKELARNPDQYIGKSLTYSGKVIQVIEGDTEVQHRIAVNNDYDSVIYVSYPKNMVSSRVLEDDYVTIYGMSMGLLSYQSTMGGKITIPSVYLDRIELN